MNGTTVRSGLGRVAVGVDGSPSADAAVMRAEVGSAGEALLRKVPLRLLQIWNGRLSAGSRGVSRNGGNGNVRDHVRVLSSVSDRIRDGFPNPTGQADGQKSHSVPGALVDALAVVVGSRGRGGHTGMRVGSVVHGLLHRAHCPVITVPAG
ncbi:universal stress protein [Streptomyces sp. NPDC093089]|uniref:universal stress protein n=1 Tax=Streptomyces sp. NPDC093089 TaxID=3366024 RepID=UPI00381CA88E